MSKFVGTGPSSYKKRVYRATVSQRLRNYAFDKLDGLTLNSEQIPKSCWASLPSLIQKSVLQQKAVKTLALEHHSYKITDPEVVEQDWCRAVGDRDRLSVGFLSFMVNVNWLYKQTEHTVFVC